MKNIILLLGFVLPANIGHASDSANLLLLLLPHVAATSSWGSSTLTPQDRPEQTWRSQFDNITPIPVTNTTDPESHCPATPNACVLKIDKLQLSSTIYLTRPHTKLLGASGNSVTFTKTSGGSFIELESNIHDIVIEGLNLDGRSHDYGAHSVFGILVNGENINKIAIVNNHIHHLHSDDDAHGIAVYGTGEREDRAITNVIIDNNNVEHMRTGSSESIAINGNVKNWQVTNNRISHINNIAIDAIGGEGTVTPLRTDGRVLPAELDAARYGFIENNTVTDMTTLTNPAYGNEHSWAGGIYVDGAHHLLIAGNTVTGSEWAYDIGAENCVKPRHIVLTNNSASSSYYGDLYIGGYAATGFEEDTTIECDPRKSIDDNEGHGYVFNVTVKSNTFTTPGSSPHFVNTIEFGNRIRKTVIIQPGVTAQHPDGAVTGDENSIRIRQ